MKKLLVSLLFVFIIGQPALADFKYTEETRTEMQMPQGVGMMAAMMQNFMQNNATIKTVYIKGKNKRVDYPKPNLSVVTKCDKKLLIVLDHNRKIYNQKTLDTDFKKFTASCEPVDTKEIKEAQKSIQQIKISASQNNKPIIMRESIIDAKLDDMVGNIKAHKYKKEMSMSGNPTCMLDMHTTEYIWTAPLNVHDYKCQVIPTGTMPNLNCYKMPPEMKQNPKINMDCLKNMKQEHVGLPSIPGYIVKTQSIIDMGNMMKNMPSTMKHRGSMSGYTGRAAGILDAVMGTLGQVQGLSGQIQDVRNNVESLAPDTMHSVDPNEIEQVAPYMSHPYQQGYPVPQPYPQMQPMPQGYPPIPQPYPQMQPMPQGYPVPQPYPQMQPMPQGYPPQPYPQMQPMPQGYPPQPYPQMQPMPQGYPPQPYPQMQPMPQEDSDMEDVQPADPSSMMDMKSITTMTRTNISFDILPESLFEVPIDYKLITTFNPPEFVFDFEDSY